jgi:flavin reductase (DIM6/NTAB) family NADH-FMN oxidoreductase RutF
MDNELPLESIGFRRLMSRFATGVTVVAVRQPDDTIIGMTANAITSVSLDPLLLLVCVEKVANMAQVLLGADLFTISVLPEDSADLSDYFAGRAQESQPAFEFVRWGGGPLLQGTLAAMGCRRYDVLDGGDHWIILGEVIAIHNEDAPPQPLIFYSRRYRRLVAEERQP